MTILDFANEHWFIALLMFWSATNLLTWPFRLVNRWIRHKNIAAKGWPPIHLDGDGDAIKKEETK